MNKIALLALIIVPCLHAEAPKNLAVIPIPHPGTEKRHESFNVISQKGDTDLVFLGDSITQGWGGKGKVVWEKHWASLKAANFGINGDRTEHVLWRIDHGNFDGIKPKAIVLMIGTNNAGAQGMKLVENNGEPYTCTAEQTAAGVKLILDKLKAKCPQAKILLLAIFPRGEKPGDKWRVQNSATNLILKTLADDKTVFYMDIGPKFLQPDGTLTHAIMPDLLHPNAKGYEIWAEAIEPKVKELMR